MSDALESPKRDRSPAFPYIGLEKALDRLRILFTSAKRHEVQVADVAPSWGLTAASSSTDRTAAALASYGLAETSGSGPSRKIKVTEMGWRILEDQRPGEREKLLAKAAVTPPMIAEYALAWIDGRPDDPHAISQLKVEGGFTADGAKMFLRVFDETIQFGKPALGDKIIASKDGAGTLPPAKPADIPPPIPPSSQGKVIVMEGERVVFTEEGQPQQYLKLVARGEVDDTLLEALEDFVKRQRKRLAATPKPQ